MSTYTVSADNLSGHDRGDTVTAADLPGANISALIASGHLKAKPATKKKEE
jgi:hypothetical protein